MKLRVCYLYVLTALSAHGQITDSAALNEVQIVAQRFTAYQTGFHYTRIDSSRILLIPAANLGQLLQAFTPIHIRAYGPSGIATASFRGTGPEHTAVLWNGFNINNTMLGQFNFTTLPIWAIDEIQIQHGGNGALFGSGAIGGTIMLNNLPQFNSGMGVKTVLTTGSFGLLQPLLQISYGNKRQYTKVLYHLFEQQNNFPYTINNQRLTMQHSKVASQMIAASHFWKINSQQLLKANVLWNKSDRQLPATLQRNSSVANQFDKSIRISAEWNGNLHNNTIAVRSGLFTEQLNYNDSHAQLFSSNNITSWINETEWQYVWSKKWMSNVGANYTYALAQSAGYTNTIAQQRASVFYALQYKHKRITATQSTRIEQQDEKRTPVIPLIGIEYKLNGGWILAGNASRGYRLPTLNEQFWTPGGNPNLKPEDSYGGDAGIGHAGHIGNFCWQLKGVYFYRNINHRIIWLPGTAFPVAANIRHITTQGLETQWKTAWLLSKYWNLNYTGQINLTRAIQQSALSANDASAGKYLIFVPRVGQQHFAQIGFKQFQFSLIANYTGMRFTTTDNSEMLNDYATVDWVLSYAHQHNKHRTMVQIGIYNLMDAKYMVMPDRPMPGRNMQLTLIYQITSTTK